ncbi:helix-turn-helix domain-containing protein [Mesorhizobium sp. AR07]|uniref:helix-turn-helix domain-containing protein n=1 Tax=Mesorhizobium sp. AR07 TaxID=2865838 RepID=UPI00215E2E26|nr:helix-turn-helix domain-containing protein [Mesorhizobium sp. AR07]
MSRAVRAGAVVQPAVFTVDELADYFRISRAGVWRLLHDNRLPKAKIGGRTLIRRVDADAFLAKCVEVAS